MRQPIQVRTVSTPVIDTNGRAGAVTETVKTIYASVQPADGKTLDALNLARETKAAYVLFTDDVVIIPEGGSPPRVRLFDDEFEVLKCEPWRNGIIDHFRLVAVKSPAVEHVEAVFE